MEKVVDVIKEKCVNCHACISSCPVKMCNKASGEYVEVNYPAQWKQLGGVFSKHNDKLYNLGANNNVYVKKTLTKT